MFLPGESQGQGSLVGCRLWGRTESDTTEATEQQQQQQQRSVIRVTDLLYSLFCVHVVIDTCIYEYIDIFH